MQPLFLREDLKKKTCSRYRKMFCSNEAPEQQEGESEEAGTLANWGIETHGTIACLGVKGFKFH